MRTRWFVLLAVMFAGLTPTAPAQSRNKALYPRTFEEVKKTVDAIENQPPPKGTGLELERELAFRRLKVYRYLAELPHQTLVMDATCNQLAQAAATICDKLGEMTHTPKNPGMPAAQYKIAAKGAASSNLGKGYKSLVASIDGYMNDSDPRNIVKVGHRRWCLNPLMQKTGFGQVNRFYGMYAIDKSMPRVPDYNFICYPARGYMPMEYFRASYAWSVTPNPAKYKIDPKGVKPSIWAADADGVKVGDALKLNHSSVNSETRGTAPVIIFRPAQLDYTPGKRYLVQIDGLTYQGRPTPIRYLVEFVFVQEANMR